MLLIVRLKFRVGGRCLEERVPAVVLNVTYV